MKLTIREASVETHRLLASWRYPPPYDFYDGAVEPVLNPERFFEALDDGATWSASTTSSRSRRISTTGSVCDRTSTGQGLGLDFFRAGLAFARERYRPSGSSSTSRHSTSGHARLRARRVPGRLLACAHVRGIRRGCLPDHGRTSGGLVHKLDRHLEGALRLARLEFRVGQARLVAARKPVALGHVAAIELELVVASPIDQRAVRPQRMIPVSQSGVAARKQNACRNPPRNRSAGG